MVKKTDGLNENQRYALRRLAELGEMRIGRANRMHQVAVGTAGVLDDRGYARLSWSTQWQEITLNITEKGRRLAAKLDRS